MKIKQIEIQGFKSFADRTIIQFEQGITGIVGPNGCGKSNVVDAIRWVLGEMSAKQLRGREMQDLIFGGSDQRAPSGMAEVAMTFSNEDRTIPQPYSHFAEIVISRRLFRSGESEYSINRSTCRLRDIYDLFLGTGVGTKAYAVVEQGQIGQLITAKPEERRKLIEEAAGISRFKARKEAALRRIEATQANLTRLEDLLNELTRQLGTLERQSKKAEKFKELKEKIKEIELNTSSFKWKKLNTQFASLEEEISVVSTEEEKYTLSVLEIERLLEELKEEKQQTDSNLSKNQEETYQKNNILQLHSQGIDYRKKEHLTLENEKNRLDNELEESSQKLSTTLEEKERLLFERNEIEQKGENGSSPLESLGSELQELEQSRKKSLNEQQLTQQRFQQLEQTIGNLRVKKDFIVKNINELESKSIELDESKNSLSSRILELNERLQKTELEFQSLSGTIQEQREKQTQSKQELESQKKNWQSSRDGLQQLQRNFSQKQSRLRSLQEIQENFEEYEEGTRKVLLKGKKEEWKGIQGALADGIEIDPLYQKALGAVLGTKLQLILIENRTHGEELIKNLKNGAFGRVSFLLKDSLEKNISSEPLSDLSNQSGVFGNLIQFLKIREDLRPFLAFLLQKTWIVESTEKAFELAERTDLSKERTIFVTPEGEIIESGGICTAGIPEKKNVAILQRGQEVRELTEECTLLEMEVKASESKVEEFRQGVALLEKSVQEIYEKLHINEIALREISHLKNSALNDLQKTTDREQEISREKEKISEKTDSHQEEIEELVIQIETASLEKKEKEQTLLQLTEQSQQLERRLNQVREEWTRSRLEHEARDQKKNHLQRELDRLQQMEKSYRDRIQQIHIRTNQIESRINELTDEVTQLTQEKEIERCNLEELQLTLASIKKKHQEESEKIHENENSLKESRQLLEKLRSRKQSLLIQITECRGTLQSLQEQIFGKYQIELSSYSLQENVLNSSIEENFFNLESELTELKEKIEKLGNVNLAAIEEYAEMQKRHAFLEEQWKDLKQSLQSLQELIHKIHSNTRLRFEETFNAVSSRFEDLFPKVFRGGKAQLLLTNPENLLESGIEIVAQPPGKKLQSMNLLSGGEKAMTAVCLIFSLFLFKPSPFCILDEVDAPLDEANIDRFNELVKSMTHASQFILITHNKRTMEMADRLYGVTMQEPGVSRTVSVSLN